MIKIMMMLVWALSAVGMNSLEKDSFESQFRRILEKNDPNDREKGLTWTVLGPSEIDLRSLELRGFKEYGRADGGPPLIILSKSSLKLVEGPLHLIHNKHSLFLTAVLDLKSGFFERKEDKVIYLSQPSSLLRIMQEMTKNNTLYFLAGGGSHLSLIELNRTEPDYSSFIIRIIDPDSRTYLSSMYPGITEKNLKDYFKKKCFEDANINIHSVEMLELDQQKGLNCDCAGLSTLNFLCFYFGYDVKTPFSSDSIHNLLTLMKEEGVVIPRSLGCSKKSFFKNLIVSLSKANRIPKFFKNLCCPRKKKID